MKPITITLDELDVKLFTEAWRYLAHDDEDEIEYCVDYYRETYNYDPDCEEEPHDVIEHHVATMREAYEAKGLSAVECDAASVLTNVMSVANKIFDEVEKAEEVK